MAHCAIPVDIPVSPPSYEEAIQTAAPEIPPLDTGSNDEPPPSYSEATKDDMFNSSYQPSELSEPSSTSDLAGLIIASIVSSHAQRLHQGRQSTLLHQDSVGRPETGVPSGDQTYIPPQPATSQARFQRRKKLSVCLLGAAMGVFLVAGLIAASVLRHKPDKKNHKSKNFDSDSAYKGLFTVPNIDEAMWNWKVSTPKPFDVNSYKSILEESKRQRELLDQVKQNQQLMDRFDGHGSTLRPFNFLPDLYAKVSDLGSDPSSRDQSLFSLVKNKKNKTFDDWIKELSEENPNDEMTHSP